MIPERKSDSLVNLQAIGQSLWMDHVGREIMYDGSLMQQMEEWPVTGLTLSPHSFCQALGRSTVYDRAIAKKIKVGMCGEPLAFSLMLDDVRYAADLLRHAFEQTDSIDGWVALPCSPLKMADPKEMMQAIIDLHGQIRRPNVLVSVPGVPELSPLIRDLLFAGIPLNISLICSEGQYLQAAEAYMQGIERRIQDGLNPAVSAFVSIPVSDLAQKFSKQLGAERAAEKTVGVARRIYRSMRALHTSQKWERAYNSGARMLRLIWNNSGEERACPSEEEVVNHLIAPLTVTSMSTQLVDVFMGSSGFSELMSSSRDNGIGETENRRNDTFDFEKMAVDLQHELAENQVKRWIMLLDALAKRSAAVVHNAL
jgi:transaldolase